MRGVRFQCGQIGLGLSNSQFVTRWVDPENLCPFTDNIAGLQIGMTPDDRSCNLGHRFPVSRRLHIAVPPHGGPHTRHLSDHNAGNDAALGLVYPRRRFRR